MTDVTAALVSAVVTWDDLRWLRRAWRAPIIVKGVLTGNDARRAIDEGAEGLVLSNRGGRQLDGVAATLRALPEIVAAVNGQAEVLMDGGLRRGSDILKAFCMGARAVLVGRAYAYGVGAAGQAGVARALEILRTEVERTMRLLGCPSVVELNSSLVEVPDDRLVSGPDGAAGHAVPQAMRLTDAPVPERTRQYSNSDSEQFDISAANDRDPVRTSPRQQESFGR